MRAKLIKPFPTLTSQIVDLQSYYVVNKLVDLQTYYVMNKRNFTVIKI